MVTKAKLYITCAAFNLHHLGGNEWLDIVSLSSSSFQIPRAVIVREELTSQASLERTDGGSAMPFC